MGIDVVTLALAKGYTDGKIRDADCGKINKPDWNQNNETAPDYVKNRPFYTGDPVETVLVEEITVEFENGVSGFQSTFEATVGETYKVYWDGAAYECTCVDFRGMLLIGNLSIRGAGSDTGEPFLAVVSNGVGIDMVATDDAASHTISISGLVTEVVKVDEKYLPTIPVEKLPEIPVEKLPEIPADKLPTIPVIKFTTSISVNITSPTQPSFAVSNFSYSEIYDLVEKGIFNIEDSSGELYSPIKRWIDPDGLIHVDIIIVGSHMTYASLICFVNKTRFYRDNWWQIEVTKK